MPKMNREQRRKSSIVTPDIMLVGSYWERFNRPYAYGWMEKKKKKPGCHSDGLILVYPDLDEPKETQIANLYKLGHTVILDEDDACRHEIVAKREIARAKGFDDFA